MELSVSYVDFLNLSADRQKKLKEHFHFECSCEHCSHRTKDELMAAAAEGSTVSEAELRREETLSLLTSQLLPSACALLSGR